MSIQELEKTARQIRRDITLMMNRAQVAHTGSALSPVEILAALYFHAMKLDPKRPNWPDRDRFILSKGHAATVLYASLANRGFFPRIKLESFAQKNSRLTCHPSIQNVPGVEATTGSLGHGLAVGIGIALAGRKDKKKYKTYVLLSDGECDEGTNWEGILFAGHHKLDNLMVIVDYNKIQSFGRTAEVLNLDPLADKFKAFNWWVKEINGNNLKEVVGAIDEAKKIKNKPQCIVAHTIKGKGLSFAEDKLGWHYWNITDELLTQSLKELEDPRHEKI